VGVISHAVDGTDWAAEAGGLSYELEQLGDTPGVRAQFAFDAMVLRGALETQTLLVETLEALADGAQPVDGPHPDSVGLEWFERTLDAMTYLLRTGIGGMDLVAHRDRDLGSDSPACSRRWAGARAQLKELAGNLTELTEALE
jgi:hypothetical protein